MRKGKWQILIKNGLSASPFLTCFILVFLVGDINAKDPKPFAPGIKSQHGVFIEKWDGIDSVGVQKLLDDPRYPYLPTWTGYSSNFVQPSNWGNNFGSRIRAYFVPKMTGYHKFYISANNEARLYLSRDEDPQHKSQIAQCTHYTAPLSYNHYRDQSSFPILLQKGKYYYIEALMKEATGTDNLDVGVKTPEGQMHGPITSEFLWTAISHHKESSNFASHYQLLKVAAKSGAKAGYQSGITAAQVSGAKAGAKAGAAAGRELGRKGGAEAGAKIAKEVITKTIDLALRAYGNRLRSHGHVINIYANKDGKNAVSITDPSLISNQKSGMTDPSLLGKSGNTTAMGGNTDPSSTMGKNTGGTDPNSKTGQTGSSSSGSAGNQGVNSGNAGSSSGGGTSSSQGVQGGTSGGSASGSSSSSSGSMSSNSASSSSASSGGASSSSSSSGSALSGSGGASSSSVSSRGPQSQLFAGNKEQAETIITPFIPINPDDRITPSGFLNPKYDSNKAALEGSDFVIWPEAGDDANELARKTINYIGFADKVVVGAYYKILSQSLPDWQNYENENLCYQSVESHLILTSTCHVFKVRKGFLQSGAFASTKTVSFESACIPGYYIGLKNFKLYVMKEEPTTLFKKTVTFDLYRSILFSQAFQINSVPHYNWYICQKDMISHNKYDIELLFWKSTDAFMADCSFYFEPLAKDDDPLQNCKNVLEFPKPAIKDQYFPDENNTYALVQPTKAIEKEEFCIALHFINKVGIPFKIRTSIHDEPYLIKEGDFRFKTIVKKPELHQLVTVKAKDVHDRDTVLLSGAHEITVVPKVNCDNDEESLDVVVTSKPGINEKSMKPEEQETKAPIHHHYHYHPPAPPPPPKPAGCPAVCTNTVCPSTCTSTCCKKDTTVYVQAKSKIANLKDVV